MTRGQPAKVRAAPCNLNVPSMMVTLQRSHDLAAVESAQQQAQMAQMTELQRSHDLAAVESALVALLVAQGEVASTEPRPRGRGENGA